MILGKVELPEKSNCSWEAGAARGVHASCLWQRRACLKMLGFFFSSCSAVTQPDPAPACPPGGQLPWVRPRRQPQPPASRGSALKRPSWALGLSCTISLSPLPCLEDHTHGPVLRRHRRVLCPWHGAGQPGWAAGAESHVGPTAGGTQSFPSRPPGRLPVVSLSPLHIYFHIVSPKTSTVHWHLLKPVTCSRF